MDCHEKEFGCLCKNVGGHFPCLFHGIYVNFEKFSDIVNKNTELGRHWRGLKKTKKLILLIRATNGKYGNELIINQSEEEFIITTP